MIPEINLLPQYERQSSVLYKVFIGGLLAILLLFIVLVYIYIQTKGDIAKVEEQNQLLVEQKSALELRLVDSGSNQPESLDAVISFAEEYIVPTSKLIDEFIVLLPDDAYVSVYDYVFGAVNIESQFETKTDVSAYVANLLRSDYLDNVKVERIDSLELKDDDESEVEDRYEHIPRYNVNYSLDVNLAKLKEGADEDE